MALSICLYITLQVVSVSEWLNLLAGFWNGDYPHPVLHWVLQKTYLLEETGLSQNLHKFLKLEHAFGFNLWIR